MKKILFALILLAIIGTAVFVVKAVTGGGSGETGLSCPDEASDGPGGGGGAAVSAPGPSAGAGTCAPEASGGPGGARKTGDIFAGLDSADPAVRNAAIDRIKALPRARLIAALREGMSRKSGPIALACAWLLDWKVLDMEELDLKVEILAPYCRTIYDAPIEGIESILGEGDEDDPMEKFRHAVGFRNLTGLLARFPLPPASGEDTGTPVLSESHRGMNSGHIPLLIAIAERDGDPYASAEAFSLALLLCTYSHDHIEEVCRMIWRLNPCAARIEGVDNQFGFRKRTGNPPEPGLGLPAIFGDLVEHYTFCSACRGSAAMGKIRSVLDRWARALEPDPADFQLVKRLSLEAGGYLRLWAVHGLSLFPLHGDEATDLLWRKARGAGEDTERAVALHALASAGEDDAVDALTASAGEGDELALALLADAAPERFDEAARKFLAETGDPESVIPIFALLPGLFGAKPAESCLESMGRMLIEEESNPETILAFHALLRKGMRNEAALKALEHVRNAPWPGDEYNFGTLQEKVLPYIEAWARDEFRSFLEDKVKDSDGDGMAAASGLLKRLDSAPDFPAAAARRGNVAELRKTLNNRSTGKYWEALEGLALTGEIEASSLLQKALENGNYGVWNEDEGVFPAVRYNGSLDFLLQTAESNCCMVVNVWEAFHILFGTSPRSFEPTAGNGLDVFTPAELLRLWVGRTGNNFVFSKIAGHNIIGP